MAEFFGEWAPLGPVLGDVKNRVECLKVAVGHRSTVLGKAVCNALMVSFG